MPGFAYRARIEEGISVKTSELNEEIKRLAAELEPYIIACRHKLHTIPEASSREFQTKAFLIEEIRRCGLPYEEVPTNSLIVRLETGRPGMTVALRADMDGLPVNESAENLTGPRVCRSEHEGYCHACGHDAHMAMMLGAMRVLTQLQDQLCGTVLFCFEEGEEAVTGLAALLEALEKYHVDRCWAIHVYAGLDEGKLSVEAGPRMSGVSVTAVNFRGKGGHGSRPDMARNPVFAGAAFLNNLSMAFGQQVTAGETVTLGITLFRSGSALNVIEDIAELGGSLRFFNQEEGQRAVERFCRIAEHTAAMFDCAVEYPRGVPKVLGSPAINDPEASALALRVLPEVLPDGTLSGCEPWYASETFSGWLQKYPGVLAFLGIRNESEGFGALHQNEKFDLNDKVLKTDVLATVRYAAAFLAQQEDAGTAN